MHTLAANITSILKRQPLSCDMWATLVIRNGLSSRDDPIWQVGEKAAQVGHCGHCRGKYIVRRMAGAVPYRLLDEASWATQGCAPLLRSAIAFSARRALAAGIRRSTCSAAEAAYAERCDDGSPPRTRPVLLRLPG